MKHFRQITCLIVLLFTFVPFQSPFVLKADAQTVDGKAKEITGTVVDGTGEPVIGAAIVEANNSQNGTTTDLNGRFTLRTSGTTTKVKVSYIGFTPSTSTITLGKTNRIIILEDTKALEEVMVTAFGEQTRSSFTGSAAVVDTKKLEVKQLTNVLSGLQGEAAGVQMINNSGDPTSTPSIRIRGFSSISAGQSPLIIVDGAPFDGGWNNLNPADVASVTVLKDASSTALYGARGANGVIMVTTKKAQSRAATITLDAKWGANSRIVRDYEMISNPAQYYETYYQALYNYQHNSMGLSPYKATIAANQQLLSDASTGGLGYNIYSYPNGQYLIGENGRLNPNATLGRRVYNNGQIYTVQPDDWKKEAFRNGLRQEYNLNINGGNDKFTYYASLGYLGNQGIAYNTGFKRFSGRIKADYQAKKWLKVGANISFTSTNYDQINADGNGIFYQVNNMAPIYPLYVRDAAGKIMYDENGRMYDYGNGDKGVMGLSRPVLPNINPLQDNALNTDNSKEKMFSANAYADFRIIDGLVLTINGSVTTNNAQYLQTSNPFYGYWKDNTSGGEITSTTGNTLSQNYQQLLNYKKDFGQHHVEAMIGHEFYKYTYSSLYGTKKTMASYLTNQTLSGAINVSNTGDNNSAYNSEGFLFRGQYDYAQRYFANASYRRDASSRFHQDHKWGNFYSVGGAWMITNESFMEKASSWLNMLKLKASFGQQGNDKIGDYLYSDTYTIVNSNNQLGLVLNSIGNKNISWETNNNINAGIEFELFGNRLRGGIEYFHKKTTDMLSFVYAPYSSGYSGSYYNVGDMVNQGVEIELSGTIIKTKNFTWEIDWNGTHYRNTITKLDPSLKADMSVDGHPGYTSVYNYYGEGLPIYTWYMPRYAGVSENGLSQWYYTASDGSLQKTEKYGDASYYLCGSNHPDLYGGFGTTIKAWGFDLAIHLTYSIGGVAYDYAYASAMSNPTGTTGGQAIHKDVLDAWTVDNQNSQIPRWQYGDVNTGAQSDRFLTNASYLTLQNINAGYNFPNKWIRNLRLQNLRVYVSADNLYYWSARKGFDPRGSFTGETSTTSYSPARTISGGVKVTF